jgi:hypothetical protein
MSQAIKYWDTVDGGPTRCRSCNQGIESYVKQLQLKLDVGITSLSDLDALIGSSGCCGALRGNFTSWRKSVETSIADIRSFGSFL